MYGPLSGEERLAAYLADECEPRPLNTAGITEPPVGTIDCHGIEDANEAAPASRDGNSCLGANQPSRRPEVGDVGLAVGFSEVVSPSLCQLG